MITRTIPNDDEASGLVIQGLEILQEGNGIVLITCTVVIDNKTLGQIVQCAVVSLPLPRRFDLDIDPGKSADKAP